VERVWEGSVDTYFGVIDVLPVIPEAGVDGLVAADGDGGGPGGAATAAVGDDVEDGGVELGAAAVIWVELGVSDCLRTGILERSAFGERGLWAGTRSLCSFWMLV